MAGYVLIRKIKSLEEQLHSLGMRWGYDKHGIGQEFNDFVAVFPKDEELPLYARDAQLFVGTLADLERWLQGIRWAREYDVMLKVTNEKKRARKEQDTRNKHTMQRIKNEEVDLVTVG